MESAPLNKINTYKWNLLHLCWPTAQIIAIVIISIHFDTLPVSQWYELKRKHPRDPGKAVSSTEIGCILNSRWFANSKVALWYQKKQGQKKKIFRCPYEHENTLNKPFNACAQTYQSEYKCFDWHVLSRRQRWIIPWRNTDYLLSFSKFKSTSRSFNLNANRHFTQAGEQWMSLRLTLKEKKEAGNG